MRMRQQLPLRRLADQLQEFRLLETEAHALREEAAAVHDRNVEAALGKATRRLADLEQSLRLRALELGIDPNLPFEQLERELYRTTDRRQGGEYFGIERRKFQRRRSGRASPGRDGRDPAD